MTEALQALIADWDRVGCAKAKEAEDAWVVGYRRGKKIAAQELRAALATPAPAQPDPLHVANERGEGEPDIEGLAETARNAYFGVSRRGPIRFDSIHPQSQQIWRNVVKAVLAAAPKGKT